MHGKRGKDIRMERGLEGEGGGGWGEKDGKGEEEPPSTKHHLD